MIALASPDPYTFDPYTLTPILGSIMISFAKSLDENETREMAKYLSTLETKIDDNRYDIEYEPAGDGGS
jgi:hypothetical protein